MIHIRFRNRETPKEEIECPVGETVKPITCYRCAFQSTCPSHIDYIFNEQVKAIIRYDVREVIQKLAGDKEDHYEDETIGSIGWWGFLNEYLESKGVFDD